MLVCGPRGIRPAVPFIPPSPQNPAGMRIEPPPSPPVASVAKPPATAAAEPPDEPPAVRDGFHGFPVTPCSLLMLTFKPPNSLDVVCPTNTAPLARSRVTIVESYDPMRSRNTRDASLYGQPATGSSSFTRSGSPPQGCCTSARAAA